MTRKAFESRVEAARPALVKAAQRGGSMDDAEDFAQEAVIVALSHGTWETVENVERWLFKIVFNLRQSAQQTVARRAKIALPAGDVQMDIVDVLAELEGSEEAVAQLTEIMGAAERAGLSSREDYIFLARLRDRSYSEIADQLGVNVDSVRASYSWALKKIRAKLGIAK